jgi:hypothetical protein
MLRWFRYKLKLAFYTIFYHGKIFQIIELDRPETPESNSVVIRVFLQYHSICEDITHVSLMKLAKFKPKMSIYSLRRYSYVKC